MAAQFRIKFNPETQEIEIEGSETFVKTYFDKVQQLISGVREERTGRGRRPRRAGNGPTAEEADGSAKKMRKAVTPPKGGSKAAPGEGIRKRNVSKTVLTLIRESAEGMTTGQLKDETGFDGKQIWAVIYRAEKKGLLRKEKRGLYVAI